VSLIVDDNAPTVNPVRSDPRLGYAAARDRFLRQMRCGWLDGILSTWQSGYADAEMNGVELACEMHKLRSKETLPLLLYSSWK